MQTKLTLRLDDAAIRRAKAWARGRGISLSAAVAAFFAQLPVVADEPNEAGPRLGPWTRRLIGAGGFVPGDASDAGDDEIRRQHREHLERKYA